MTESLAAPLSIVALVVALVALAFAVSAVRSKRASVEHPRPASVTSSPDLEAYLVDLRDRTNELAERSSALVDRIDDLEASGRRAVKLVGLVRFNPFDDTGSNQSFALAMLDGEVSGFVLSSLHSRQQTRVYLKEIVGGNSEVPLSAEETEALRRAGAYD